MNFRPLPPSVQDDFDAALLQILRETPLLKYPTVEYYQRIDDAVALCCPHFDFADLHGEDLRSMQMSLAHKHVFGRLLLAVNGSDLDKLCDHLKRYLEIRPTAEENVSRMCQIFYLTDKQSRIGTATMELIERFQKLDEHQ